MTSVLNLISLLLVSCFALGPDYVEPWTVSSSNGLLQTTFIMDSGLMTFNGSSQIFSRFTWNYSYIGPVLKVNPGDRLLLTFVNRVNTTTNVHFHGLHVSPTKDNAFIHIGLDESYTYDLTIPLDHPLGTFWYHSHAHGLSEPQVFNGLSGSIVIGGIQGVFGLSGLTERVLQLKDLQYITTSNPWRVINGSINSNAATTRTVNGIINPTLRIAPGEVQLWRVLNIAADIYFVFNISGLTFYELARDSRPLMTVIPQTEVEMGPGTRITILVVGPPAGEYVIQTNALNNHPPAGDNYPDAQLATLLSTGTPVTGPTIPTTATQTWTDLRPLINKPKRVIYFNQTSPSTNVRYFVNGYEYDPARNDVVVNVGDVEEWELQNGSSENHWFHIHQTDFQVKSIAGVAQAFNGYQDTVTMIRGTSTNIIIPFTDPYLVGKFLFHCHIMSHEDTGMMGTVVVQNSGTICYVSLVFLVLQIFVFLL